MARRLTPSMIENLPLREKPYLLNDALERGLTLRVSPQGAKTFRYRLRSLGKVVTLGPWTAQPQAGHVTLRQAREWVEQLRLARKAGNLAQVETDLKSHLVPRPVITTGGKTVADAAAAWWPSLDTQRKRKSKETRQIYEKHIAPVIGHLPLEGPERVRKSQCAEVVERVAKKHPIHAGKVLQLTKQLLDFAGRRLCEDGEWINPAGRLRGADFGVTNPKRNRALADGEIRIFWRALDNPTEPKWELDRRRMAAALRLLLLLGVRSAELRLAEWESVDLDAKRWVIPAAHRKLTLRQAASAHDLTVPLPPGAVAQFRVLKDLAGESPRVVDYAEKTLSRFMRRFWVGEAKAGIKPHPALAKLPAARPHDLRRSLRTGLGRLKIAPHIGERILGHSLGKILEIYDVGDYFAERRDALTKWDRHVRRLVGIA